MSIEIVKELPNTVDAIMLIDELENYLASMYPIESRHGLSSEQLIREDVAFFVARVDGLPAGCGGVKFYGADYAEIKRMYVRLQFRQTGLGKLMLSHLEKYSLENGLTVVRLETGIYQPEAMRLYEKLGYRTIPPFGHYREDVLCRFYEKKLA